ncbi:MAG: hypothetical protein RIQ53_3489 [Pseudomonadota bacterium]|jgi:hypothetical protein
MKVLNLQCSHGHGFEGWFGSEQDYLDQQARRLVRCPVCDGDQIEKRPSAPRLNLSGGRPPASRRAGQADEPGAERSAGQGAAVPTQRPAPSRDAAGQRAESAAPLDPAVQARLEQLHAAWIETLKAVVERTEDVGARFTEEARRIHYGETEARGIRGTASPEQRAELAEEGVEVVSLPMPAALKGPQH